MKRHTAWRRPYPLLLAVLAAALVGFLLWPHKSESAADKAKAPPATPVAVVTAVVTQQDVPLTLTGIGTVQAAESVTVRTRVDGQLQKVAFHEGQDVRAGQLLAQIDPRPFAAQLAQSRAQLAKDEAQLANARADLERYATLSAQDSISPQAYETQRALVRQLIATVANDRAQVEYATVQLGYTTITAPIGGRTGVRLVDAGNIVHASDSTGLVVINQIDPITVLFTLPEDHLEQINAAIDGAHGQALAVTALAREDEHPLGEGLLLLVNNQIDTNTGTVQLKAQFPNRMHKLWPGQYVDARLNLGSRHGAFTVPASALQRNQNGPYVYRVQNDQTVAIQPVKVAEIVGNKAVLESGVSADMTVVAEGQLKLKPGMRIRALPPGGRSAS